MFSRAAGAGRPAHAGRAHGVRGAVAGGLGALAARARADLLGRAPDAALGARAPAACRALLHRAPVRRGQAQGEHLLNACGCSSRRTLALVLYSLVRVLFICLVQECTFFSSQLLLERLE